MEKCPHCNREFKNKAGLAGHIALKHPEISEAAKEMERQKKITVGHRHVWQRLSEYELNLVDGEGVTIRDRGYRYVCRDCDALK